MKKLFLVLFSIVFINSANAGDLSKKDMEKAWDCVGIYMANYFLPSGETFESVSYTHLTLPTKA